METFLEIIQAVQSDLTIGDESSFLDLATVKLAINRAYINKVSAIFLWPQTEDSKETSSIEDQEYYEYPDYWRPNSIWKLVVDGTDYKDPLVFKDYKYEKANEFPAGNTKIWANKALRYFITPTPTADGTNNIEVHGMKIPDKLVNDDDLTIFSKNMPELNEAIVEEAKAILKAKGDEENSSDFASKKAFAMCVGAWGKLKEAAGKYKKTLPQFDVPDLFARKSSKSTIGNFN